MKTLQVSNLISCLCLLFLLSGCAAMRPPIINTYDDSIYNYRYFYITPTSDYTSSTGIYGGQYGISGGTSKTTNPATVIGGALLKNGFIQVNEVSSNNEDETMIVNFGETGRRNVNLGYSIEVTIQFISASNKKPICVCTAEGQGETEADDVRKAIQRALAPILKK